MNRPRLSQLQIAAAIVAADAALAGKEDRESDRALEARVASMIKPWDVHEPVRAFDARLSQMWKNRVNAHANRSKHQPHIGKKQAERAARQAARAAAKAAK